MFAVTVKKLRSRNLIGLAHSGDYQTLSETYAKLFATLDARDLTAKTRQMVAVFYDSPETTPTANLRAFAGVTVAKSTPCAAPLQNITLPTARHAVLRVTGPYSGLPAAYAWLYGTWLPQSGETLSGQPSHEVYLNTPGNTPAQDLLTEICLPLT